MKRGLIVSGGGALGAFGVGTLAALNKDYNIVAGISTGALMGSLVALKKFDILKEAYTSVTRKDIFDTKWYRPNVFKKNGKVNELAVLYVLITRLFNKRQTLNTLGTSNQLRKLIDKFFTIDDYNKLKELNKEVVVGAVNVNSKPSLLCHFSSLEEEYEDFKDWVWCSANAPFFMTLLRKKWYDAEDQKWYMGEWTDGGVSEIAPFNYILESGCKEIDIIMHRERPVFQKQRPFVEDFVQNLERTVDAIRFDIEFKDGKLMEQLRIFAEENDIKITIYWLPRQLTKNSLMFEKNTMLSWYEEGFNTAFDPKRIDFFG